MNSAAVIRRIAGPWLIIMAVAWPLAASVPDLAAELAAANALVEARKVSEAKAAFERILAQSPGHPDANWSRGLIACDEGDWERALRCERIAVTHDPSQARYHYGWAAANGIAALKAGLLSRLGYARQCLAAYRRAVELEPANVRYRWALLNYYQQAPGIAGGDRDKALEQAAELKKLDAESGRQAYAQLYVGEKKYDLAFGQYDDALRQAPDDIRLLYQFGRLTLLTDRRLDEGLAAFRRLLDLKPPAGSDSPTPANIHWRLGNVWEKKHAPDRARTEYRAALALDPDFRPAQEALAKLDRATR